MVSPYLIFYVCLELRFPDEETNLGALTKLVDRRALVPSVVRVAK